MSVSESAIAFMTLTRDSRAERKHAENSAPTPHKSLRTFSCNGTSEHVENGLIIGRAHPCVHAHRTTPTPQRAPPMRAHAET